MRNTVAVLILMAATVTPGVARPVSGPREWTPTPAQIAQLEAHLPKIPDALPAGVQAATRYYFGQIVNGHRFIVGEIVSGHPGERPGVHMEHFLPISDGGCGVINLTYDVAKRSFVGYACNGMA